MASKWKASRSIAAAGQGTWQLSAGQLHVRTRVGGLSFPSAEDIYRVVFEEERNSRLPPIALGTSPRGISFSRYPASLEIRLVPGGKGNATDLSWSVVATADGRDAVITNVMTRKADHIVIGSSWYPFESGALNEIQSLLSSAGIGAGRRLTLRQFLELQKLGRTFPAIRDLTGDAASANNFGESRDRSLPKGIVGDLYSYQLDGWRWLSFLCGEGLGGILADEMGLGKTLQIIALLSSLDNDAGRLASLIVAPGTLLENWRRELSKFAPSLLVVVHHGGARSGFPSQLKRAHAVVTSYDTVVRDIAMLRQVEWDVVVLDEAQAIKNPITRRALTVKRLIRRIGIAVTGTPLENRLIDLWSIADFVLPGFLGEQSWFERTYANDREGAAALEPLVTPILLRRRIRDVARDLPERIDIPQAVELDARGGREYEELRKSIFAEYGYSAPLVALTKLRMYCAHPFLLEKGSRDPAEPSQKYQRLLEIVEEIIERGEKALLFTSYNEMSDILTADLSRRFGIFCSGIDGRVPIPERQTIVDRFSSQRGSALLVLNPRAGGTGLNIAAANHVIHYNLEWNPAVEDQASARAYRRGQRLPVTVHRLYYANTVEEVIDDRLSSKRHLADAAVVGTTGAVDDYGDIVKALKISPIGVK
jgi:SNF2 family DNA or RNA helicase